MVKEKTNKVERLPITNDYIFKRVFAFEGNESILKDFLEAILKKDIKEVEIKNPEIIPYEKDEKRGLLDIKAQIDDGTILDIEMQMEDEKNIEERGTEYLGKMISEQLQEGEEYIKLKKSIVIFITNYNFLKRNSYHSVGKVKFDETLPEEYVNMGYKEEDEIASKYIEFHYIELPKYKKKEPSKFTKLDQWMCIFTQNEEGIILAEKENKEIKKAMNTLDYISADPKEREIHNSILMAEYNRLTSEHNFFEAGKEERNSKRKIWTEEKNGEIKGKKEKSIEIAKEMLKEFDVDSASAGNIISDLKCVSEILIWIFLTEDKKSNLIRANIRSRGPIINEIAAIYGGGGHKFASGARLTSWSQADNLIKDLDNTSEKYIEEINAE